MEISRRAPPLSIAIPASLVTDIPHLREKTLRVGLIGRASAIFRVDEVVIYSDLPERSSDAGFISSILSYMETPQYLRKLLFPLNMSLRYVGILPPLRTPNHPIARNVKDLRLGEFREGVVVGSGNGASHVEIGVEWHAFLDGAKLPLGRRITVRIIGFRKKYPRVHLTKREEISIYWGYRVSVPSLTLGQILKGGVYDLVVATSRSGEPLTKMIGEIRKGWKNARKVLVAFGSPDEGLMEIIEHEDLRLEDIANFTVNTIPLQGTETVRTEEAVWASLAALNTVI